MLESTFIKDVLARAKQHYKTIVLPEGEDLRVPVCGCFGKRLLL